ncbi:MAG: hypothetical protein ACOYWZ_07370 [Bacillota bacterium]
MYRINQEIYHLRSKYALREWGMILKILSELDSSNINNQIITLLADNKLIDLLNLILDHPIVGDIYEEDFEEVNKVIRDFFSRKSGLIKNTSSSLENCMRNMTEQPESLRD